MKSKDKTTCREFITKTGIVTAGVTLGASTLSTASYNRILGANDKVNMGFIGLGLPELLFEQIQIDLI